ncbi:MAG: hypothetical protein OER88_06000 [Planctomycetota bacterium]|nr:hypothetical protein [Planctomycetota bacterium]
MPPRILPLVYFYGAHICLVWAFVLLALRTASIGAFFFHPRMFAVVHLITLGWITPSILGATYLVAPLALRTTLRAGRLDAIACGSYWLGVSGVVMHFWLDGYWGVATSGPFLIFSFAVVGARLWSALRRSRAPLPVRWIIACGYGNVLLAATLGSLVALHRVYPILPGTQLENALAHAHLATIGWATMLFVGVGARLLPMFLPAAPPPEGPLWGVLVLLEGGILALTCALLRSASWAFYAALAVAAGLALFLGLVVWMLRHSRPPPKKMPRPDPGKLQALLALVSLVGAIGVGLFLVGADEWHLGWTMVYGVLGLVGFLAQAIAGVGARLLPMFAWLQAWVRGGYDELPVSQYAMASRPLQFVSVVCWAVGVPLLAWGLARGAPTVGAAGAWALAAGVTLGLFNLVRITRAMRV